MKKILKNILLYGSIVTTTCLFSAQLQAASNYVNTTGQHNVATLDTFVAYLSHYLPSMKKHHTNNHVSKKLLMNMPPHHSFVTLQKTAGASGMFRRVVNAPSAGGRLNPAKKLKANTNKSIMKLAVSIPAGMGLSSKDFKWIVRSTDKKVSLRKIGKSVSVPLPAGKYNVRLTVGSMVINRTVKLGTAGKTVRFPMVSGNLKASVGFAGGGTVKAKWDVYKLRGNVRGKKVYSINSVSRITRTLAPGKYEVVATVGRVVKRRIVNISAGKTKIASMKLTGAKVRLLATKRDKQTPLLKRTQWTIKSVATKKTVATKNRHSATVTLPPGKYIAIAVTDNGVKRSKNFVVRPGRTNTIHLAME